MKIKNKCLLPPWVLMIIWHTIGSSILVQHNTWHWNENGSQFTNPLFHERCTWEMTPFWKPLAKGTISLLLINSFWKAWKWNLTRTVVRWTMSMELLWWKHARRRTCIFSTLMFERRIQICQSFWMKELRFGTNDLATSTCWVFKN